MSTEGFLDLCSDDEIVESGGKNGKRGRDFGCGTDETDIKEVHKKCRKQHERNIIEENRSSNALSTSQSDSSDLDQACATADEPSPFSLPSFSPPPICRQFWKAGNYEIGQGSKATLQYGKNHLSVHPMFLHSNATSHKWAFGAIAELLDNAVDEIPNGASFVVIDKITNPRDGSPALLIQDDGGGMDPEELRRCMSFGFSDKKLKSTIGQYGNGFKTSSMRLGADVIVFTRHLEERKLSQSVGLLSYTFLRQTGQGRIVVPMVDYEFNESTIKFEPILRHDKESFSSNLSVLLQWSPYLTEETLLKQFDDIGQHGTKIVIYNLWLNDNGDLELDFNIDAEDIQISSARKLLQSNRCTNLAFDHHIANLYRYSLRVYISILYLRVPESFKIILCGQNIEHHNLADDLKFPEFILYRPHVGGTVEAAVVTTIGFLKDAPHVHIQGFNIYHRNRLVLPFWRVVHTTNNNGRGVVGVLEANFMQPTHDKQDFEKTSLFQKLEARLKQMTMEYWKLHCELIGYHQMRKASKNTSPESVPSQKPLPSRSCSRVEQPDSLVIDNPQLVSLEVGSFEDDAATPTHAASRSLRQSIDSHHLRSQHGINMTRKEPTSAMELEHAKRPAGSGSYATDNLHIGVEQRSCRNGLQFQDEETINIMRENEKLHLRLMELERRGRELELKVQQLRSELGGAQLEYAMLLAESESMDRIKMENKVLV